MTFIECGGMRGRSGIPKKHHDPASPTLVLFAILFPGCVAISQGVSASALPKTAATTAAPVAEAAALIRQQQSQKTELEPEERADNVQEIILEEEEENSSANATTKSPLTGNPQVDYKFDPNLPRELNGFNLSEYPFFSSVRRPRPRRRAYDDDDYDEYDDYGSYDEEPSRREINKKRRPNRQREKYDDGGFEDKAPNTKRTPTEEPTLPSKPNKSVFEQPRKAPRIKPPVPLSEKEKYARPAAPLPRERERERDGGGRRKIRRQLGPRRPSYDDDDYEYDDYGSYEDEPSRRK
ncbi:uncharacterized protein LOC135941010 [Cloeon dipterum]|uniref:uncharacterized protein LOC135941010 n=1 Tax=Cloeon dipterum TaxID=197152 RepID=UPI00321FD0B1